MSAPEKTFRRNFAFVSVMHVVLIIGVVVWNGFVSSDHAQSPTAIDVVMAADILGELPRGAGHGRGNYEAPPPEPQVQPHGGTNLAGDEQIVQPQPPVAKPPPPPSQPVTHGPNEILIPKKTAKPTPTPVTSTAAKPTTVVQKQSTPTQTAAKNTAATGTSASEYRKRLEQALKTGSKGSGTVGGDNRPAGGGTGTSRIGSPGGAADGIPGGVGQGSPFWQYYLHVHDKMYEAWEQPGEALNWNKQLMTTVTIRVARGGRIDHVALKGTSGNKLMDDSAMAAARRVLQLNPPPDGLVKGVFAEITVNFQMEG